MGTEHQLTAAGDRTIGAYQADPAAGGMIVLQGIFGVNAHICEVCDGPAADGFVALARALPKLSPMRDRPIGYSARGPWLFSPGISAEATRSRSV